MPTNKTTHTPGPWMSSGSFVCANPDPNKGLLKVALCYPKKAIEDWGVSFEEAKANRDLIAAAPLYDTNARRFVARMDGAKSDEERVMIAREEVASAAAAIAKAEGR
jgi:hypothetical protein